MILKCTNSLGRFVAGIAFGVIAMLGLSQPASALTLTSEACLLSSMGGASNCAGIFEGNDSNQDLSGLFGTDNWSQVVKVNSSSGTATGNGVTLNVTNSGGSGNWTIDDYMGLSPIMFVTKGGPTFSAFLMLPNVLSGTWDNQSMLKGNGKRGPGLSHFTVYTGFDDGDPNPVTPPTVPLPAGLWLLISGAGALGGLRWKNRNT